MINPLRLLEAFRQRKRGYQLIPNEVIADLARFCRAYEPCFHEDARVHALLEGRREVFLHIMKHRELSPETLYHMWQQANPTPATFYGENDE